MSDLLMNVVDWSRAQFALTACYHWLFVPLTLGLGIIIGVMETIYYRTRDEKWLATTKFWMTLFGVNFAIGVATGIILEFEFGTNWSNYSWFVGDIFGAPLAIEGILAFFMESTFIAVMFFGWKKVSPKFHLASTWLTALGASISALWILVANAWMQHPVGCTFNPETMRNEMTDFWAVAFSPMAVNKVFHTVTSAWALSGAFVVGVCGWMLLKGRNRDHCMRSLKVGGWVGLIGIVLTSISGDTSAVTVAKHQPMKLAAMEGLYEGDKGQSIVAFGILNPAKEVGNSEKPFLFDISIPHGLAFLATHDINAFVPGIEDILAGKTRDDNTLMGKDKGPLSFEQRKERGKMAQHALAYYNKALEAGDSVQLAQLRKDIDENFKYLGYTYLDEPKESVPNVPLTFYSFHFMVTVGGYLVLFFIVVLLLIYKPKWVPGKKKLQKLGYWLAIITIPLAYLCSMSGWIVAEVGRQPWTIQDLMPNKVAISDLSAGYVQTTFWIFAVVFTALLIADVSIICKQISKKSKTDLNKVEQPTKKEKKGRK
ncbi:MAG: cytochrome ubiquinol oxidase subunit I [Muribaculaceae bacterium]|nr:cytochrome ubiquinol oxidase subunit I [Muribaculaceae bacterium]